VQSGFDKKERTKTYRLIDRQRRRRRRRRRVNREVWEG
jgi:hypothetical protein